MASLSNDNAPTAVSSEYADIADIFSPESAAERSKHTGINDHSIDLVDDQQSPHESIYSLGPLKLGTLRTYIETNPVNGFI